MNKGEPIEMLENENSITVSCEGYKFIFNNIKTRLVTPLLSRVGTGDPLIHLQQHDKDKTIIYPSAIWPTKKRKNYGHE